MKWHYQHYRIYIITELIAVIFFDILTSILLLPAKLIQFFKKKTFHDYSSRTINNILLFRTDRMGDLIMTLPAIKLLRIHYPTAKITLIAGFWNEPILQLINDLDEVQYWNPPWISRMERNHSFIKLMFKAFGLRKIKYDLAIDFTSDIRVNILMWLSGAKRRVGYTDGGGGALLTEKVFEMGAHRVEQNLEPLKKINIISEKIKPQLEGILKPVLKDENKLNELFRKLKIKSLKPIIIIHPWGGRPVKTWNQEKYAGLASQLMQKYNAKIILTGSSAEHAYCEEIQARSKSSIMNLAGVISITDLMYLLLKTDLFISPDTGPMHLATAIGTHSVTLFGPSDINKYAPYGDKQKHRIVYAKDFPCLYCNKIRRPPRRCTKNVVAPCMEAIKVNDCFKECEFIMKHIFRKKENGKPA